MATFAAGLSRHPIPSHAVAEAVGQVLEQLVDTRPTFVLMFVSPDHVGACEDMVSSIRTLLEPDCFLGCTGSAIIGGAQEVEGGPALSLFAAALGGTRLQGVRLDYLQTPDGPSFIGWPDPPDPEGESVNGPALILMADPFSFPADQFLARINTEAPDLRVIGGLASAAQGPGGNRIALDGAIYQDGAVGVLISGGVSIQTVVSQGCRPIGSPYTVTKAERNIIYELGGRPALQRLQDTAASVSPDERNLMRRGLHIGRVVDERGLEFSRGDFLVRTVIGGDQENGAIAVNEHVEVGHTVQFHVRDADSADEDLRLLLSEAKADGALLFTCNGRGTHMFEAEDHDASLVSSLLGPLPLAGFFCAGELGPVGSQNFVHAFTASLALFEPEGRGSRPG